MTMTTFDGEHLCTRCGHPIENHRAFNGAPPADLLPRLTEARFRDAPTVGIYCPHLDMVAGEDYDDT